MAWQGNGMSVAWVRHAVCESAFNGLHVCTQENTNSSHNYYINNSQFQNKYNATKTGHN